MPIAELDELFGAVTSAEDKAALEAILERNPSAKTAAIGREELYKAFVSADDKAIDGLVDKHKKTPAPVVNGGGGNGATNDIAALEANFDRMFEAKFGKQLGGKTLEDVMNAAAEKVIASKIPAFESELLGKAARTSDSVYNVRRMHEKEFNEELDTAKFEEFITGNPGFTSLEKAHDAYVQEKRIEARIAAGIKKADDDRAMQHLPGSDLPKGNTVLGDIVKRAGEMQRPAGALAGDSNRGASLDAAVRAFRETASGQNGALHRH